MASLKGYVYYMFVVLLRVYGNVLNRYPVWMRVSMWVGWLVCKRHLMGNNFLRICLQNVQYIANALTSLHSHEHALLTVCTLCIIDSYTYVFMYVHMYVQYRSKQMFIMLLNKIDFNICM